MGTVWLPTDQPGDYAKFDGFLCSPGSPHKSFEGALSGIRYARENKLPLIGTGRGFQHLVIEYARNVVSFQDAAHADMDPYTSRLMVTDAERSKEAFNCNF